MQIKRFSKNKGFTLVETIVYTFGLVLLLGTMTGLIYYMYNWYQFATLSSKIDQVGLTVLDQVIKDVRTGTNYDPGDSSFGVPNGSLSFNTVENDVSVIKKYSLSNNRIQYQKGGVTQYLSPDNMTISRFFITPLSTDTYSKAVRIEIEITLNSRSGTITREFDGLAILRNSYPL